MSVYALASGALVMVAAAAGWFAFVAGLRAGRMRERAATNRYLHDSVLPAFEAFGLATPSDEEHAPVRLADLRRTARAQAGVLRRGLADPVERDRIDGIGRNIDLVARDFAVEGLSVDVDARFDEVLPGPRQVAMREALREALRNTVKHSGADRVEIRVVPGTDGVTVESLDRGLGFEVDSRPPGFGITESIMARMREVGGTGVVVSRPGVGTRVTLWVPR